MFRTRQFPVFLFAIVLMANAFSNRCVGQESIDMRPTFTPDSVRYIELVQQVEDKWEASSLGPARTQKREWTRGVLQSIDPPWSQGNYIAPLTFDRVAFRGTIQSGEQVVYDSDLDERSAARNPARNISRMMIGQPFVLLITEEGRGSGVTGLRALYKKIEEQEAANPLLEMVMGSFSEDTARYTWGHFPYSLYAFASVKVGDTWGVPLRAYDIFLGETQYDMKCRLDGITSKNGRKIAKISFTATLSTPPDARKGMHLGITRLELQSGKLEGTAEYDIEQHEFINHHAKTVMNIYATISGDSDTSDEMFGLQRTMNETRTVVSQERRAAQRQARKNSSK